MVQVVKSEWHQVEKRYGIEIDTDTLADIYPDMDEDELDEMLVSIETGNTDIQDVIDAAMEQGVDLDWDWLDEDDWWTDRKGGYDVTYEVQGE
jgi:hypothetical protein